MLKIIRVILAIAGVLIGGLGLVTENFGFIPYLLLIVGASLLISGGLELQRDKRGFWGYANILIALFAFYVSIESYLSLKLMRMNTLSNIIS